MKNFIKHIFKSLGLVIQDDLIELKDNIMSKISEFAAKQSAFNDRIDAAITGITGDITHLNDLITQLQNTQGTITPEDQALLDQIESKGNEMATKLEALDALTPPVVPVVTV